jgi:hypothetical protein
MFRVDFGAGKQLIALKFVSRPSIKPLPTMAHKYMLRSGSEQINSEAIEFCFLFLQ